MNVRLRLNYIKHSIVSGRVYPFIDTGYPLIKLESVDIPKEMVSLL